MKKLLICLTLIMFSIAGCTGSFQLTKSVNKLHREQDNRWVDELLFLGLVIIPVYGLAMLGDAVIFNSVEFWTGDNPVAGNDTADETRTVKKDGASATIVHNGAADTLTIKSNLSDRGAITLSRNASGVVATDSSGTVIGISSKDKTGGVHVYDGDMNLIRYFPPEEVLRERQKL